MEWLYGLLIGSTFTAVLMHLAHRGHHSERARYEKEGYKVQPNGIIEPKVKEPWPTRLPYVEAELAGKVTTHLERGNTVDSLDDIPTDCTCDWQENKRLCEEEGDWCRTMQDPECPRHRADDGWLLRYYANRPGGY
jgi:hypothetical protein